MRWGEIIRRLVLIPPTLFGVCIIVFVLLRVVPGDPIAMMIPPGASPADSDRLRAFYGLDPSIPQEVLTWAGHAGEPAGRPAGRHRPAARVLWARSIDSAAVHRLVRPGAERPFRTLDQPAPASLRAGAGAIAGDARTGAAGDADRGGAGPDRSIDRHPGSRPAGGMAGPRGGRCAALGSGFFLGP